MIEERTVDATRGGSPRASVAEPGLLQVWGPDGPMHKTVPIDRPLEIGRDASAAGMVLDDPRISRVHCRIRHDGTDWRVEDLGSRNGTFVDGARGSGERVAKRVLRVGRHMFLFVEDLRVHARGVDVQRGFVCGARQAIVYETIARAAKAGGNLLVTGESGSGKERAARHFHGSGPRRSGPFVAVNCATIPAGLAERLLFGAKKGAFSGATDAAGYLEDASGGVLFLDEIGELDLEVQAKLLRVLETGELVRLGATRPIAVDVRICGATHRNLRSLVADASFRADLYYRIGRPDAALPALRERPEEIPFLLRSVLDEIDARLDAEIELVEACLLRPWPGNVRELLTELRFAAQTALDNGRTIVTVADLSERAGAALPVPAVDRTGSDRGDPLADSQHVRDVLDRNDGNVSAAARELGVHRTQLRRWIARSRACE